MRLRSWGTWVAKITNPETHQRSWIGSYNLAAYAVCSYDLDSVSLHVLVVRLNFPPDSPMLGLGHLDPPSGLRMGDARGTGGPASASI